MESLDLHSWEANKARTLLARVVSGSGWSPGTSLPVGTNEQPYLSLLCIVGGDHGGVGLLPATLRNEMPLPLCDRTVSEKVEWSQEFYPCSVTIIGPLLHVLGGHMGTVTHSQSK
jgi:hypothetical protein